MREIRTGQRRPVAATDSPIAVAVAHRVSPPVIGARYRLRPAPVHPVAARPGDRLRRAGRARTRRSRQRLRRSERARARRSRQRLRRSECARTRRSRQRLRRSERARTRRSRQRLRRSERARTRRSRQRLRRREAALAERPRRLRHRERPPARRAAVRRRRERAARHAGHARSRCDAPAATSAPAPALLCGSGQGRQAQSGGGDDCRGERQCAFHGLLLVPGQLVGWCPTPVSIATAMPTPMEAFQAVFRPSAGSGRRNVPQRGQFSSPDYRLYLGIPGPSRLPLEQAQGSQFLDE